MLKKILSCLGPYKKYVLLTPLFMIVEVLLEVFIPMLMSKMIDIGIPLGQNGDMSYIVKTGIMMIVMAVLSLGAGVLAGRCSSVAGAGLAKGVRGKLFRKIQDFSFSNIDKFSTSSLVTRLTTDVTNTQNAFTMTIRIAARAPFMLISAICMAVAINKELSLIFIVAIPILAAAIGIILSLAYPRFQIMLKKYDKLNAKIQENLIGIRVVKAFVRGDYENEKFQFSADEVRRAQIRAERIVIFNMPIMQLLMYGCMIAVSWLGGNLIISGNMLTGELMSFISYISQILMSLMMIAMVFMMIVMSRASISRIVEVFDEQSDITDHDGEDILLKDGSVKFENVTFSYYRTAEEPTLNNINLEIASGETVGIIGGTGSAKSTLVQLIPRLYDTTQGKVIVGGHDVRDYKLDTLRNNVAMVLQKNVLFSGTIKENLKWGNENATDTEIIEACEAADAHGFITSFPDGYETDLGQGGVNVSGGQKQRLCIARALLKKPKIIILDDSTSAVDTATDSKIRTAFREKLADTTTIIIAQRVSSVSDADKIIVMDDGKINAVGTHEELLASNEIYREVYESQQKGGEQ